MNAPRFTHYDRLELRLDKSTIRKLPGGAVMVDGIAARTGLYTYRDDKGDPFVELVPASTLFNQASMDSMAGASFNIRHPDGLVTPENFQAVTHGAVVKAWQASDTELGVRVRIGSEAGLKALADGMVELSPAYEVDVSDTPGSSEHGHHDGVQVDRDYNALAGLWAGEARGGPEMRLQLDGPVCAPPGCRIQSHRVRHDSAQGPKLMKTIKVKHKDGKTVELDGSRFGWLRYVSLDAATAKRDQIETGRVTIEIEGEEASELILPVAMIELLLEGIGGAPAAPAEPEGMEPTPEEQIEVEAQDSKPLTLDAVSKLFDRKMAADKAAQRKVDARDSEVVAAAGKLNVDASDGRHWAQIACDAIVKADPTAETLARKLAIDATAGDLMAEGWLRGLLNSHANAIETGGELAKGTPIVHTRPKNDAKAPWETGKPNKKEQS